MTYVVVLSEVSVDILGTADQSLGLQLQMAWETFIISVFLSSPKTSCWSLHVFDSFTGGLHPTH
jgi:hypothetical protein